jgi:hypothetical protein
MIKAPVSLLNRVSIEITEDLELHVSQQESLH